MSLESGAGWLKTYTAETMARESVLVVDDERDILELVKYNLGVGQHLADRRARLPRRRSG